jgi:hypothetical protein
VELGPYRHYMQKEIFEQPSAVADTLEGIESITPALFGRNAARVLRGVKRVLLIACPHGQTARDCDEDFMWIRFIFIPLNKLREKTKDHKNDYTNEYDR